MHTQGAWYPEPLAVSHTIDRGEWSTRFSSPILLTSEAIGVSGSMWRGLVLVLLQGQLVSGQADTCRHAHDNECDEPRIGTGACTSGTDWTDCKNSCRFAYDGVCDEPAVCGTGTDYNDCVSRSTSSGRRGSSPPPPPEDGFEEFEEEEEETQDMKGWQLLLQLTVIMVILFFPCIVFGCAYCSCIRQHNEIGASARQ